MGYSVPLLKDFIRDTENDNHKFEVVSLFAGGGGSSTGYRMAGGKVLAINEFIEEAQATYKANYPSTHIFTQDIKKLTAEDILERINKKSGELDLLDGSPPCSAFSTAGAREKGWGKTKTYSDTTQENVEDLFFDYIRILRGVKPKVFVAENVAGMVKGKAKGYFNHILRELKSSGYHVTCKVLDAKYLGIPQSRQRVIFVGIRDDIWRDEYTGKTHPKPASHVVDLKEAFEGLTFTEKDKLETDLSRFAVYKLLLTLSAGEAHKKAFTLKKCSKYDVSFCITANTGSLGAREIYHWNNRAFTINEVKRIMSVPDDYILTGTYQQQVERLGRMVAPLMMKAVADNLVELVFSDAN